MKATFATALAAFALSACVTMQDGPMTGDSTALPVGSAVALGQPVALADVVLTPMEVTEDSRCPINARCVWAGEIIVKTRVDGSSWREIVLLKLGEPQAVRGNILNLVSAEPGQIAGQETDPAAYRFTFEGRPPNRPPD